jgi:RNA polymerase sigma-70 factor (ECF subfamily)
MVLAAADRDAPDWRQAMAGLCMCYWQPIYTFIRLQGFAREEAEDLTQGFFTKLLEKDFLKPVDREKGSFRSYLLACLRHFLSNERDRGRAQKRGAGRVISLDYHGAETRYRREASDNCTPERIYERQWALTVLQEVLDRLETEWRESGRSRYFEKLKVFLSGEDRPARYAEVARQLEMGLSAVKVAVHRLRRRYREVLREEIGRLVGDPGAVDDEIRCLFAAVREGP